jgi:hypothetical protein
MKHRVAGAPLDFAALRQEFGVPGDFASMSISLSCVVVAAARAQRS